MNFNNIVIVTVSLVFAIGVVFGAFILNNVPDAEFARLFALWNGFLNNDSKGNIIESIFKYGKTILALWLCGFFKYGFLGIILLIFSKGLSVGFTSSFIIKTTGSSGIFFVSRLYLLQTLILIILCFSIGIAGTRFSLNKNSSTRKSDVKNYCLFGTFQLVGIIVLSLLDIIIS